jgi:hypothetical protein
LGTTCLVAKTDKYGELSPERRQELLDQQAAHGDYEPTLAGHEPAGGHHSDPGGSETGAPTHGEAHGGVSDGSGASVPFSHPSDRVTEVGGIVYLDGQPKMPVVEFQEILDSSVHNANAREIMLGKYDGGAPDNYINKAKEGGYSYFDLGLDWNRIAKTFGLNDKEMFQLFNVPFLDDAMRAGEPSSLFP